MQRKEKDELGLLGEQIAAEYLESIDYAIIERNWKHKPYEIDIIAQDGEFIVIVEVKTRTTDDFGDPQDFVTRKKQSFLVKATQLYADVNNISQEFRFDVIAVLMKKPEPRIEHLKGAFIPLLGM